MSKICVPNFGPHFDTAALQNFVVAPGDFPPFVFGVYGSLLCISLCWASHSKTNCLMDDFNCLSMVLMASGSCSISRSNDHLKSYPTFKHCHFFCAKWATFFISDIVVIVRTAIWTLHSCNIDLLFPKWTIVLMILIVPWWDCYHAPGSIHHTSKVYLIFQCPSPFLATIVLMVSIISQWFWCQNSHFIVRMFLLRFCVWTHSVTVISMRGPWCYSEGVHFCHHVSTNWNKPVPSALICSIFVKLWLWKLPPNSKAIRELWCISSQTP